MQKRIVLSLLGILISAVAFTQSKKVRQAYSEGRQNFIQKKYTLAIQSFETVINSGEENTLIANAYYYTGQAYLKQGNLPEARQSFQRLLENNPNWSEKDEVYYSLADIAFQEQRYDLAFEYINRIQSADFQKDIYPLIGHYVQKMDMESLKVLQKTYPEDTIIAQILVDKIAANSTNPDDFFFMRDLVNQLNLDLPSPRRIEKIKYIREPYKVAVMLPFDFERLRVKDTTGLARLSIQMYQGMRLAQKELDSTAKAQVQLYAYDIGRGDEEKLNRMILAEEFKDMDLVFGPLFDETYTRMADLALIRKFNLVNPLSINQNLMSSPFTYLYQPSLATQAEATCDFIQKNYRNKNVVIFHDNLARNRDFAQLCQEKANTLGLNVLALEKINTTDLGLMSQVLSRFSANEIGHIIVSSTSQLIALELMKVLRQFNLNSALFVPEAWLRFQAISYEDYERENTHFIHPDYLNTDTEQAVLFKKNFIDFANTEPESQAYLGYEMLYLFAELLEKAGTQTDFREEFRQLAAQKGIISEGLDFGEGNDNQFVPILKVEQGEIKVVSSIK